MKTWQFWLLIAILGVMSAQLGYIGRWAVDERGDRVTHARPGLRWA